jgi:hypothetical protein
MSTMELTHIFSPITAMLHTGFSRFVFRRVCSFGPVCFFSNWEKSGALYRHIDVEVLKQNVCDR